VVPGYSWSAHLKDVHIIARKVWLSEIRRKPPREPLLAPSKVLQVFDVLLVVVVWAEPFVMWGAKEEMLTNISRKVKKTVLSDLTV